MQTKATTTTNEMTGPGYMIRQWKEAELLALANHFHKLDEDSGQFLRVKRFDMTDVAGFNKETEIYSMQIRLGLMDPNRREVTFRPILTVVRTKGGEEVPYEFTPVTLTDKEAPGPIGSEPVPAPFKDMITENWDNIDINQIDDLFVARTEKTGTSNLNKLRLERVHYFAVEGRGLDVIRNLIGSLKQVIIYPGVDMNKSPRINAVSFTPIIGLVHPTVRGSLKDLYGFGRVGNVEFADNESYVEYSRPCPPTCHP